jgi:hypothetical protein
MSHFSGYPTTQEFGVPTLALDCITMSAPLDASSLWLLGSGGRSRSSVRTRDSVGTGHGVQ